MKEQINRFARGVFEYEPPVAEIEETSICAVVDKNRDYDGSIHIYERSGKELKGIVYSDNDKVIIEDNTFSGSKSLVKYKVVCNGALNGDMIEGLFSIVSNGGEETVPFSFRVEAGSFDTSAGTIRNLFHFANLAQTNIEEAVTLFESEDFEDVYIGDNLALRCIYESLIKGHDTRSNIEEFLIAIHKKNRVNINLIENNRIIENIEENYKDSITIEKDTWGYCNVAVLCNTDFIKIERHTIDTDLFTGNRYDFSYIIDYDKLHQGKNYGKIVFMTSSQTISYTITVNRSKTDLEAADRKTLQKLNGNLMSLYVKLRIHAINVSEWTRETKIVIEAARAIDDSSPFYRLALAQVYITEKNQNEAKALIENVKDEINPDSDSELALYCYFIYVNSLYNRDRAYAKRATVMIKECYEKSEDWRILWTLLFIDEELENNKSLKLLRIKEQFNKGCHSPALYIEACNILNDQPQLLRIMNAFEISVLIFGAKNKILNPKLCILVSEIIMNARYGTDKYIRLMMEIYKCSDEIQVLECLCKILIRNNVFGNKYLDIYGEAIKKELKITQLFEYYIMSKNINDMSPMPKMVLMYFSYNNNLDYVHKAYLYANIINNKTDNPQMFRSYIPQMESFMMDQLLLGHINDELAIIYKTLMTSQFVTEENAESVAEIYFTYKMECSNPNLHRVSVRHKESNSEKEYDINGRTAYVRMYTDDAALIFISDSGNRYSTSVPYNIVKLLDDDKIISKCLLLNPELIHVKLYNSEKNLRYQKKNLEAIDNIKEMAVAGEINKFYRGKLISIILDYYYDSYDDEGFDEFISQIKTDTLDERDFVKIIEIMIIQGEYEKAYELTKNHSIMQVNPKRLLKLCSRIILSGEHDGEEHLVRMSEFVFNKGRYDELLLGNLVDNYNGTTSSMIEIWKRASEFEIDTYDLEERIIAQMMFSHSYSEIMMDVFSHYYGKGPKDRIVEAYLAYNSYMYFVKEIVIPEEVFSLIEASMENEKEFAVICSMALIKYYSELDKLSEFRKELAEKIITDLTRKEYVFPFYQKLKDKLKLPFDVADKTMIEYRTNPKNRVIIHYMFDGQGNRKNYISEAMNNVYDGIFVKEFVLFYGENLQYYITEISDEGENITESCTVVNKNVSPDKSQGRYEAINDMLACQELHDNQTFQKLMHVYAVNEHVTNKLFKIIE